MDSKLRTVAILSCMAMILLVSVLVLYMNGSSSVRPQPEQTKQPSSSMQGSVANGQIGDNLSAFLTDSTFFDPEPNFVLDEIKDKISRLSMVITSVEKDLRIQIVNTDGALVTGEGFYVELEGLGRYKDLDRDGVIYIGGLTAGDYYVTLLPLGEYKVPENATKVRVKDKVEYLAIEDISLLIKTEEEIDAEAEDTAVAEALADADRTEIRELQKTAGTKVGIDVSKWNGDIDWNKVREAGVEYAILRVGYRGSVTGSLVEDPNFAVNIKGAVDSGMPVGVYFFTQAINEVEAVEEASAVLQLIGSYQLDYPVFIDTEGAGGSGRADELDAKTRTLVCEAFCRTIKNAGYEAGVYGNRHWFNDNLEMDKLQDYRIWLAEYRSQPLYQGYYDMWQYTSKGEIDGISGDVDMSISYME